MTDKRTTLSYGCKLHIQGTDYIIQEEIGRGASSIVYGACYYDTLGLLHNVRIKECYPVSVQLERDEQQHLVASHAQMKTFVKEKENFCEAYRKQVEVQKTLGLVNATVSATQIYEQNQTMYIVMEMMEGCDYRKRLDDSLMSVLIHIRAIAQVIANYHKQGYLYLDLKPENVLILPETKECVVLFDFDSLIRKEDLRHNNIRLAGSPGFAAPEQMQGHLTAISERTDIYAVGAMLYYKVFGKVQDVRQCQMGASYPWQQSQYADERHPPVLYRRLTEFLQHTMVTSVVRRWNHMEQVIEKLDELIVLSDVQRTFVYDNFQYHNQNFVGREKELLELDALLHQHHAVFVHGVGGIGKTELVRRYAQEHREQYDTIIFLPFQDNIMETFIGDELRISQFSMDEKEDKTTFMERKYKLLHEQLTSRDMLILDNFDVAEDAYLEKMLALPCKFLITTREDYRDYNYVQMEVTHMLERTQLTALFQSYNNIRYTSNEMEIIYQTMELVEYHTMTIELIAKYLRDSDDGPEDLLHKLHENTGIIGTLDTSLKHRKDQSLHAFSMCQHLRVLFDLSGFRPLEQNLLQCLALLGPVRIRKDFFISLYSDELLTDETRLEKDSENEYRANHILHDKGSMNDIEQAFIHMIQTGWLQYEEEAQMISLHQIILDLVYNELKPDCTEVEHFLYAMRDYACRKPENYAEKQIKRRLLKSFASRVEGESLALAEFYLAYCYYVRNDGALLKRVEVICESFFHKTPTNPGRCNIDKYHPFASILIIMREVCCLKIRNLVVQTEQEVLFSDDEEAMWKEAAEQIIELAMTAQKYDNQVWCDTKRNTNVVYNGAQDNCHKLKWNGDYDCMLKQISFRLRLVCILDEIVSRLEVHFWGEEETVLAMLCEEEAEMVQSVEEIMWNIMQEQESLRKPDSDSYQFVWKELLKFYQTDDYCAMYRSQRYGDEKKEKLYETLMEQKWVTKEFVRTLSQVEKPQIKNENNVLQVTETDEIIEDDLKSLCDTVEEYISFWQHKKANEWIDKILSMQNIFEQPFIYIQLMLDKYLICDRECDYERALECCKQAENVLCDVEKTVQASEMEKAVEHTKQIPLQPEIAKQIKWWKHNIRQKMGDAYYHLQNEEQAEAVRRTCDYFYLAEEQCKGERQKEEHSLEDYAEIWEDAAYAYYRIEEYEQEKKCYAKALQKIACQRNYKLFHETQLKYVELCIRQGACEEAYWRITELTQKWADDYRTISKSVNPKDVWQVCVNQLQDIANAYEQAGYPNDALLYYLNAFLVYASKEAFGQQVIKYLIQWQQLKLQAQENLPKEQTKLPKEQQRKRLVEKTVTALQQESYTKQDVDVIVDLFARILPLAQTNCEMAQVVKAYQVFTEKYVNYEIAFKH